MKKNFRIIPKIDIKNNNLIKGINLEGLRVLGDPYEYALSYYEDGADELIFNDVIASLYNTNTLSNTIKRLAKNIFIPITAGGGIRNLEIGKKLFNYGADKIFVNTQALIEPKFLKKLVNFFGSANVIITIEIISYKNEYYTSAYSGREIFKINPFDWALKCEDLGCGEIMITSVNSEGLMKGTDILLFEKILKKSKVPIIGSGGIGSFKDVYNLARNVDLDGVVISSLFHYNYIYNFQHKIPKIGNTHFVEKFQNKKKNYKKKNKILELKKYLKTRGINVRL